MRYKKRRKDWASAVLAESPDGSEVLLVRKTRVRGSRAKEQVWQFPGGKREATDSNPKQTAVHEVFDETGVRLTFKQLRKVGKEPLFNPYSHQRYDYYLFRARLTNAQMKTIKERGDEGEEVSVKKWSVINSFGEADFSPFHRDMSERYKVWKH